MIRRTDSDLAIHLANPESYGHARIRWDSESGTGVSSAAVLRLSFAKRSGETPAPRGFVSRYKSP